MPQINGSVLNGSVLNGSGAAFAPTDDRYYPTGWAATQFGAATAGWTQSVVSVGSKVTRSATARAGWLSHPAGVRLTTFGNPGIIWKARGWKVTTLPSAYVPSSRTVVTVGTALSTLSRSWVLAMRGNAAPTLVCFSTGGVLTTWGNTAGNAAVTCEAVGEFLDTFYGAATVATPVFAAGEVSFEWGLARTGFVCSANGIATTNLGGARVAQTCRANGAKIGAIGTPKTPNQHPKSVGARLIKWGVTRCHRRRPGAAVSAVSSAAFARFGMAPGKSDRARAVPFSSTEVGTPTIRKVRSW